MWIRMQMLTQVLMAKLILSPKECSCEKEFECYAIVALWSLLHDLCYAVLQKDMPASAPFHLPLAIFALPCDLCWIIFGTRTLFCHLCYASFSGLRHIFGGTCHRPWFLCNPCCYAFSCYAIHSMPSMLRNQWHASNVVQCNAINAICDAINVMQSILGNMCYAIYAMQSMLCKACFAINAMQWMVCNQCCASCAMMRCN